MGKHISDTCTMRLEIYYVHPQARHMQFLDMSHQVSNSCLKVCSGTNLWTNILHTQVGWGRITKINGCLAVPANIMSRA